LRNHDPEFRRLWDEARDLGDLALEDEAYERSIIGGSDGMLKFVLQKRLPERWEDPPKNSTAQQEPPRRARSERPPYALADVAAVEESGT